MKLTEIRYLRVFNLGDYEKEEMSIGFVPNEDATLEDAVTQIGLIQARFRQESIPYKKHLAAKAKSQNLTQTK